MAARTGEVADKKTKTGFVVAAVCDRRKTNATLTERRYKKDL